MSYYETRRHIGPDGKISITVPPALTNIDVRITIAPEPSPPLYPAGTRPPARNMTQEEWRDFIDEFAGSMPDFPDVPRPGPESYRDAGDWS